MHIPNNLCPIFLLAAVLLGFGVVSPCLADNTVTDSKKLDFADGRIWSGPNASGQEVQAAKEIQTFLTKKLAICQTKSGQMEDRPAIIVGTAKNLPEIAKEFPTQAAQLAKGTNEAFLLHVGMHQNKPTALILANEPIGALYSAYTFLEKFGIGFYLGGDVYPGTMVPLQLSEMEEFWSPTLPIRGCVIWYNFLNGPTTRDLEDHKFFFDQMIKMKANLVSFPEYGYGLTNYLSDGKLVPGVPFHTSENYGWGTVRGMKTAEFGFGTGLFFAAPAFGSKATTDAKDAQDAIRRSQELFVEALKYAKQRGINVCLGFQRDGVPDDAHAKDVAARLKVLVTKYPSIDYIWFWQCDGASVSANFFPAEAVIPSLVKQRATQFDYLPNRQRNNENRALDGARMAVYIENAYDALKAISPEKRVVISGWGGDKWMFFTDLFPGLDKILPKDIIFSSLDNIDPSWEPNVSEFYGKLPDNRQRWAIPWWESDGGGTRHDQFMPQCNVKPFPVLLPDVFKKGCNGVLGIHWRTRGVEDVARYTVDFAWNPGKTNYEAFWADFARRCFGVADAPGMSKILMKLESLGPRWTGGGGQHECQPFTWMDEPVAPKEENVQALKRIRQQLQTIADRDTAEGKVQYLDRVERLIYEIDFALNYDEAAMQILKAQAKSSTDKAAAAEMLVKVPLGKALQTFTRCFTRRAIGGCWPR